MEYFWLLVTGILMGISGGLLGIGGAVVMIPALAFIYGPDQHLFQASAMICSFFVGLTAAIIHHREQSIIKRLLTWMLPFAICGVLAGVAISNLEIFSGGKSYYLSRIFGLFLVYVAGYNIFKACKKRTGSEYSMEYRQSKPIAGVVGILTGIFSGLLGIGAGTVMTPLQQLFLHVKLKNAMSNSSATIIFIAFVGAIYKNLTLSQHGYSVTESFKIAAVVTPMSIIGSFIGSKLMHILPVKYVRFFFIAVVVIAAAKMLSVGP